MKPTLNWTKSKVEAYAPGAAIQYSPFWLNFSEIACCGRRSSGQPPFRCDIERDAQAATFKSLAAAGAL
jgi:hypothetical protein